MMMQPSDHPIIKQGTILPLMLSMAVHALAAGLFFWQLPTHTVEPVVIETTFISTDELGALKSMIQENAVAAKSDTGNAVSTSVQAKSPKEPSPHMQAYNEEMAQRQAAHQAQMEALAKALDEQLLSDIQAIEEQILIHQQQQAEKLAEGRQAYEETDEKIRQNQLALEEAKKARDARIALAQQEKQQALGGVQFGLQTSTLPAEGGPTKSTHAISAQTNIDNTGIIIDALIDLIEPNWHVPANAKNERLTANIHTDINGHVLSVQISGSTNAALRASLKNAIVNSSPLTPLIGTEHQNLIIHFSTDPPS